MIQNWDIKSKRLWLDWRLYKAFRFQIMLIKRFYLKNRFISSSKLIYFYVRTYFCFLKALSIAFLFFEKKFLVWIKKKSRGIKSGEYNGWPCMFTFEFVAIVAQIIVQNPSVANFVRFFDQLLQTSFLLRNYYHNVFCQDKISVFALSLPFANTVDCYIFAKPNRKIASPFDCDFKVLNFPANEIKEMP